MTKLFKGTTSDVESDEEEDSEEEDDDDGNSEDDPERLWCVCNQPHNNRFMIACDQCLDWYHGKCVGITKKMGKDMEAVGNEWRCPKCKEEEEKVGKIRCTIKLCIYEKEKCLISKLLFL